MNEFSISQRNDITLAPDAFQSVHELRTFLIAMRYVLVDKKLEFKLPIKDFFSFTNSTPGNYSRIIEKLEETSNVKLRYEDGKGSYEIINVFSRFKYQKGEGHFFCKVNPDILPYYVDLAKDYTLIPFTDAMKLMSVNAFSIFKIVCYFQHFKYKENVISLDELKVILSITHKKTGAYLKGKEHYKDNKYLNRSILKRSQKEIKEKTQLTFDYELINRGGGRIKTHVHFYNIKYDGKPVIPEQLIDVEQVEDLNSNSIKEDQVKSRTTRTNKKESTNKVVVTYEPQDPVKYQRLKTRLSELGLDQKSTDKVMQCEGVELSREIWTVLKEVSIAKNDGTIRSPQAVLKTRLKTMGFL